MGQNQPSELSEEEKKELSIGLLREWWITSTQALVDSVGTDRALASLNPYHIHAAKAGGMAFQKLMGFPNNNPFASAQGMGFAFAEIMESKWSGPFWWVEDDSSITEFHGCMTKGQWKEVCISCCQVMVPSTHQETSPDFEMKLSRSMAFGDTFCEWLIQRRDKNPTVSRTERLLVPEHVLNSYAPSMDLQLYLCHAWLGELWVLATRAFIDAVGPDRALERLRFYMRHSGMSTGIRLSDQLNAHEKGLDPILLLVRLIQDLHQKKGSVTHEKGFVEGEIGECPFASSAPPEICAQYEAFFNGVCEAIDPSYEFAYDRMMTKGDKTCHWTIRRKGEPTKEKVKDEVATNDPAKILATRYAKGEISKEELQERMNDLKELGLVR